MNLQERAVKVMETRVNYDGKIHRPIISELGCKHCSLDKLCEDTFEDDGFDIPCYIRLYNDKIKDIEELDFIYIADKESDNG